MARLANSLVLALGAAMLPAQPALVAPSDLHVRATPAGSMPASAPTPPLTNATSPCVAGAGLLLIDQRGFLHRRTQQGAIATLLTPSTAPFSLVLVDEAIVNVAANMAGDRVAIVFMALLPPNGVPVMPSPRGNATAFEIVCAFDYDGTALTNARALVAFAINAQGHTGGGMVVLADDSLLLAFGDNGDAFEDGRQWAQDATSHLGKLVRIDLATGAWSIAARGVRNPQRLVLASDGAQAVLAFVDIGGLVAEELNVVPLAALVDGAAIENFGWGRAADGHAREGTFYIDANGALAGAAPIGEAGFVQPVAQWAREGAPLIAASGPVVGAVGFTSIAALYGDLPTGVLLATTGGLGGIALPAQRVALADASLQPTTLAALAGGRPDPRFFTFPDGRAGVLLERTGALFVLDELPATTARMTTVGTGCASAALGASAVPRLGTAVDIALTGGAQGASAWMLLSFARALPPPDLAVIAMPGCVLHLLQPIPFAAGVFDGTGGVHAALAIPPNLALCGLALFVQGVTAEPQANPFGLTTTALLALEVGL